MASYTAKDVQDLRQQAGVGMMEAKKALDANGGDKEASLRWLRENGLASMAKRSDRENTQGAVAIGRSGSSAAIAQVRSETDFVAKSPDFVALVQAVADTVAARGEAAATELTDRVGTLRISLKENIEIGRVVRFDAPEGSVIDTYLHMQSDRGVNAVMVEVANGSLDLAHELALHVAFARPKYLVREEVPAEKVAEERTTLETLTRNEGKPEAALPKIVEGRLNGFFKELCLIEQDWAKDNKQSIKSLIGSATITRFAQVEIG